LVADPEIEPDDYGCIFGEGVDLPAASDLILFQLGEHLRSSRRMTV
jgi:hypothetical protein